MSGRPGEDPDEARRRPAGRSDDAVRPPAGPPLPAVAAAVALTGLTVFGTVTNAGGAGEAVVGVVTGILACTVLVGVRRWPVPGALVLAVLAAVSPAATPSSTIATTDLARRARLRTAALIGLAGVTGHAVRGLWQPIPGLSYGWWLVLDVVVHAGLVGWGAFIGSRRALIASLVERARRAEEEQGRRVAEARAAERTALAREMHDVLAHRLSLVATHAGALEYRTDASPAQIAGAAGVIRQGVHEALVELREVIGVLRSDDDAPDRPRPGLEGLGELVARAREAGAEIDLDDRLPDLGTVPAASSRTAHRIVQEALTNAHRHASGAAVRVVVDGGPGAGLDLEIRNRLGRAAEGVPGTGTGLVGLTERARLTGGRLDHGPTGAGEFRVHAWLPWPA